MKNPPLPRQAQLPQVWRNAPLPFKALAIGMLASYLPGLLPDGLGVSISYIGWIVPLLACGWVAVSHQRSISFPLKLWLPWALWVVAYLLFADADNALQRSVMLLTPLAVGAGFSTLRVDTPLVNKVQLWFNRFFWIFLAAAGVSTGLLVTGQLAGVTGFASGAITASLLAVWYAARYADRDALALYYWAALALVPVLANTRTGMVAVALTLPFTFKPLGIRMRLIVMAVLMVAGVLLFQTERIQKKMFYSGHGTLSDAVAGITGLYAGEQAVAGDFATSGRKAMNDYLVRRLDEDYWFGHGANTTEIISFEIAGVTHPHNDWLRVRYEYGMLGMVLFALTMLAQTLHAFRRTRWLRVAGAANLLLVGAGAFIPMAVFMFSDNVMLYAAWFGNLQFALLGLGYAALRSEPNENRRAGLR